MAAYREYNDGDDSEGVGRHHIMPRGDRFVGGVEVAQRFISFVVGKKGKTLQSIQRDTGTKITVPKHSKGKRQEPNSMHRFEVEGDELESVREALDRIQIVVASKEDETAYTHFLSIPLNSEQMQARFASFEDDVMKINARGIESKLFTRRERLHLTLCMLRLPSQQQIDQAISVLKSLTYKLNDLLLSQFPQDREKEEHTHKLHLRPKGLEIMNDDHKEVDVLYVKLAQDQGLAKLKTILRVVLLEFVHQGVLTQSEVDKQRLLEGGEVTVKFHMTLMNSKHRTKGAGGRETFDAKDVFQKFANVDFGSEPVPSIHLSAMAGSGESGYYACAHTINIP